MTDKSISRLKFELDEMTERLEIANEYADGLEERIAELEKQVAQPDWTPVEGTRVVGIILDDGTDELKFVHFKDGATMVMRRLEAT